MTQRSIEDVRRQLCGGLEEWAVGIAEALGPDEAARLMTAAAVAAQQCAWGTGGAIMALREAADRLEQAYERPATVN